MCHLVWLLGRKYGTVWYHPASSKLWYLTSVSFVNFQEKLTGTSSLLFARAKPAFRLAVCLALGALFASTDTRRDRMACVGRTRGAAKAWPSDGKTHKHYLNAPAWVVSPVVRLGVVESFTTPAGPDI
jgi:hypothetical protein